MRLPQFIRDLDIGQDIMVMGICVLLGAVVLTQFTRMRGVLGFSINSLLLFGGAYAADYLTRGMDLPLGYFVQRTLLVSFGGMLVSSLVLLLLFPRPGRE